MISFLKCIINHLYKKKREKKMYEEQQNNWWCDAKDVLSKWIIKHVLWKARLQWLKLYRYVSNTSHFILTLATQKWDPHQWNSTIVLSITLHSLNSILYEKNRKWFCKLITKYTCLYWYTGCKWYSKRRTVNLSWAVVYSGTTCLTMYQHRQKNRWKSLNEAQKMYIPIACSPVNIF